MFLVVSLISEGGRDFLKALVIRLRPGPEVALALVLEEELEVLPDVLRSLLILLQLALSKYFQLCHLKKSNSTFIEYQIDEYQSVRTSSRISRS